MNFTQLKRKLLKQIEHETQRTTKGIPYDVFIHTPDTLRLREEDKGKRVWHSAYPRTEKIRLESIEEETVTLNFIGQSCKRFSFISEVILHPSEWSKERINE